MKTSRIADEDSVSKEIKYIHTYILLILFRERQLAYQLANGNLKKFDFTNKMMKCAENVQNFALKAGRIGPS
jgi:hypothetical protein